MFKRISLIIMCLVLSLPLAGHAQNPTYDVCPRGNPFGFTRSDLETIQDEISGIIRQFRTLAEARLAGETIVRPRPRSIDEILREGRRPGIPEGLRRPIPRTGGPAGGPISLFDLDATLAAAAQALETAPVPSPSDAYLDLRMRAAALSSLLSQYRSDTRFLLLEIVVLQRKMASIQEVIFAMLDDRDTWRCLKGYSGLLDVHFNLHDGTDQTVDDFFDEGVDESGHKKFRAAIDAIWDLLVDEDGNMRLNIDVDDVESTIAAFEIFEPLVEEGAEFIGKSSEIMWHSWHARLDTQIESPDAYQIISDTYWPNLADPFGNLSAYQGVIDQHLDEIRTRFDELEALGARQASTPQDEFESTHEANAVRLWHTVIAVASAMEMARDNFFGDAGFHDQIDDRGSAFRAPIEDAMNALVLGIQVDQGYLAAFQQSVADFCSNIRRGITGCGS